MVGTLINTVAILVGTALGLLLRKGIPERLRETVLQGQGLCVILIGLSGALKTGDTPVHDHLHGGGRADRCGHQH